VLNGCSFFCDGLIAKKALVLLQKKQQIEFSDFVHRPRKDACDRGRGLFALAAPVNGAAIVRNQRAHAIIPTPKLSTKKTHLLLPEG
jgi:hypothetical protein